MVQINFAQKEIQCKIVYYGPGMSGKTTNLELVHGKVPDQHRGELTSIATTGERTLYFDYMPLDLGQIAGIRTKFQLYTVPGQIYYKSTRRLVLQGVDGIVFVADSSPAKMRENLESWADLEENLQEMGKAISDVPILIQYNKRDLPDAMPVEELERQLNPHGLPSIEAVASRGDGVFPTLKKLASLVLEAVNRGGLASARATKPRPSPVTTTTPPTTQAQAPAAPHQPAPSIQRPVGGAISAEPPARRPMPPAVQPPQPPQPVAPQAPVHARPAAQAPSTAIRPPTAPPPAVAPAPQAAPHYQAAPAAVAAPVQPAVAPAPTHAPASAGAPSLQHRGVQDRVVQVAGLNRRGTGNSRLAMLIALGAIILGAAAFVFFKM